MQFACEQWVTLEVAGEILAVSDRLLRKACERKQNAIPHRERIGRREVQPGPAFAWLNGNTRCPRLRKPVDFDAWNASAHAVPVPNNRNSVPKSASPCRVESSWARPDVALDVLNRLETAVPRKFESVLQAALDQANKSAAAERIRGSDAEVLAGSDDYLDELVKCQAVLALAGCREIVECEAETLRKAGHSEAEAGNCFACLAWLPLKEAAAALGVSERVLRKHTEADATPKLPCREENGRRIVQPGPAFQWLFNNTPLGGGDCTDEAWKGHAMKEPADYDAWQEANIFIPLGYFEGPGSHEKALLKMIRRKLEFWPPLCALLEVIRYIDHQLPRLAAPAPA